MPLLGDEGHKEMVATLSHVAKAIEKPSAMIVVSAHWEQKIPTITHAASPKLIYDYFGFPAEAYEIQYPAPGDPNLAQEVFDALTGSGIEAKLDAKRGFDHGLFVPLKIMFPEADIPCIQLSLTRELDPLAHIKMGEALSRFADDGVLIIGSGFSFHNMKAFGAPNTPETQVMNEEFEDWLIRTCEEPGIDEPERERRFLEWAKAPSARYCHPREEHLLPLHVCYGATKRPAAVSFELSIINKKSSMFLW
ncbi:MAG: class III extradiol ring-cleavage dioxygenase [Parasphingorhabdus sp.]